MATIKSHTDIEQSKKLVEILPIESADMYYWCGEDLRIGGYRAMDIDYDIPCWSLAALLDVLPNDTYVVKEEADTENERYMCTVGVKDDIIPTFADNPVDACYEMILKLHEFNLL